MVQILEDREPSFAQSILGGLAEGIPGAVQQYQQQKQQARQMQMENEAAKRLGIDLSGIQNPEMRKAAMTEFLKQQGKEKLLGQKQDFVNKLFEGSNGSSGIPSEGEPKGELNGFNPANLSDEAIVKATSIDPALGRELREAKKSRLDEEHRKRKEQIEFHKESQKYDEELLKHTKIAKTQADTIKTIEKAISTGKVKPSSLANILKGFGPIGNKMADALLSGDEATLQASIPGLLEGWKEVFGVRLSDADLRLLQDKLPSIGKSPEANKAILKVMKKYSEMTLLRSKIASEIKEKNKGLRPLGFADKVEQRFDEMVQPVKVISPKTGNVIEIPAYRLSDAIESGAKLYNE